MNEAENIQLDVINSNNIDTHKDNFQELVDELNKLDAGYFNSVLNIVLKDKQNYLGKIKPIDFLLDWKYEIVKVLCTQKLETLNNEKLVNKFKCLNFEQNRAELTKALQNLKVAESTQKIILDDFVQQNGFESLELEPFEQLEEKYGIQVNNRDEDKTIFLPVSNDFIKLCKVIWRIIKNTYTGYESQFKNKSAPLSGNASIFVRHVNRVFTSKINKDFFIALCSFNDNWRDKLAAQKSMSLENDTEAKAWIYCEGNDIFAYFNNLSHIKCIDTECTEFANRLDSLYFGFGKSDAGKIGNKKQRIYWNGNGEGDVALYVTYEPTGTYKYDCNSGIIMHQSTLDIPERRETRGQKIKKFVLDLLNGVVNGLAKKWDSLSRKTKKIIFFSLFLVFTAIWILVALNVAGIVTFMSLTLSWTIAIICWIGMSVSGYAFVDILYNSSENLQRDLNNQNNLDLDSNATVASKRKDIDLDLSEIKIESDEIPLIVIGLDEIENEDDLSSDLKK